MIDNRIVPESIGSTLVGSHTRSNLSRANYVLLLQSDTSFHSIELGEKSLHRISLVGRARPTLGLYRKAGGNVCEIE